MKYDLNNKIQIILRVKTCIFNLVYRDGVSTKMTKYFKMFELV